MYVQSPSLEYVEATVVNITCHVLQNFQACAAVLLRSLFCRDVALCHW